MAEAEWHKQQPKWRNRVRQGVNTSTSQHFGTTQNCLDMENIGFPHTPPEKNSFTTQVEAYWLVQHLPAMGKSHKLLQDLLRTGLLEVQHQSY